MTTIAYKDGVLAADRQVTRGTMRGGEITKIRRLDDGSLVAVVGQPGVMSDAAAYLDGKTDTRPTLDGDTIVIHVLPTGSLNFYEGTGWLKLEGVVSPFYAFGSGRDFAYAAMSMGATPEAAVKVASQFCIYTNGNVDVLRLVDGD